MGKLRIMRVISSSQSSTEMPKGSSSNGERAEGFSMVFKGKDFDSQKVETTPKPTNW